MFVVTIMVVDIIMEVIMEVVTIKGVNTTKEVIKVENSIKVINIDFNLVVKVVDKIVNYNFILEFTYLIHT